MENNSNCWKICPECSGEGKIKRRIRKQIRIRYQKELENYEKSNRKGIAPVRPFAHYDLCKNCCGSGLIHSENFPVPDSEKFPHVAIIGGGIGGAALATACLHRGIPFTLYERDKSFDERSQGYGLTLQQASNAIKAYGISNLEKGVVSTRHLVHNAAGKIVGEWGMRKWLESENNKKDAPKRTNIHIARQSLRSALLEQLGEKNVVKWKHQLIDLKENIDGEMELKFQVDDKIEFAKADLVVGADGIRSAVRTLIINENITPLRYLDCMVILGICPLNSIKNISSNLLDSETVFQTANGNERIYVMPFDQESVMWQLSFPISETDAKILNEKGSKALKREAILRTKWHDPIPQILEATNEERISGYPVYDRELLSADLLKNAGSVTLIGDAAHPMSPFKGQGANQALLDALSLAREIYRKCKLLSKGRENSIRERILNDFEAEMLARSSIKVEDSAAAAEFLHSEIALFEGDEPRGRVLKRKNL